MSESRPPIPADMKRQIRKESYYGCVCCGNPIIEYHHIKDWCIVKEHSADNLVALCPTCHYRATVGELTPERILKLKKHPFNSNAKIVSTNFFINQHDEIFIKLGNVIISTSGVILRIYNDNIISLSKDSDGFTVLNLKFYDQNLNLVAEVKDNEWIAHVSNQIWDITFTKGILDIRCSARKVWLKVKTENSNLELEGKTYYNKGVIQFDSKKGISIEKNTIIDNSLITINGHLPDNIPVIQIGTTLFNTRAVLCYD